LTALKKFKCRSGRHHQNIFCGPDSPLFALPQLSNLANDERIYYFSTKENYYFSTQTLVRQRLKYFKCRSGRQHQNIFCGPDSPLFALPQLSHLANDERIYQF